MVKRAENIKEFILNNISEHPADIIKTAEKQFGISRQAVSRHLHNIIDEGLIVTTGNTKARKYELRKIVNETFQIDVSVGLEEDVVWRERVLPFFLDINKNVVDICQFGFTEILNNVIDHSESDTTLIGIDRTAVKISMMIRDYGIGIFNKIKQAYKLHDSRHALFELTKGKLSSSSLKHSGEGIFFTSRMFDEFSIRSGNLFYCRINRSNDDWLVEVKENYEISKGTVIFMDINPNAKQTKSEIFDKATSGNLDHEFSRTHVPLELARYGNEQLVSRSQAKRVLARFDRFKEVLLDFRDVEEIGPAFADEIFRVFRLEHPEILIIPIHVSDKVMEMIDRAMNAK